MHKGKQSFNWKKNIPHYNMIQQSSLHKIKLFFFLLYPHRSCIKVFHINHFQLQLVVLSSFRLSHLFLCVRYKNPSIITLQRRFSIIFLMYSTIRIPMVSGFLIRNGKFNNKWFCCISLDSLKVLDLGGYSGVRIQRYLLTA